MVPSSYCVISTSHVTVFLSHSIVVLFFLTFDGTILTLCSTNVICDYTFITFSGSLIFFLTFEGIILTLYSTNFTCDCTFITFCNSLIFSHIRWYHPQIVQYQHHMWLYFCYIRWFPFFFLTFDNTILILYSTNISCDCIPYFFSHLMIRSSHCAVLTSHVIVLFVIFGGSLIFFLYLIVLSSHYVFNLLILVHCHPQYLKNI